MASPEDVITRAMKVYGLHATHNLFLIIPGVFRIFPEIVCVNLAAEYLEGFTNRKQNTVTSNNGADLHLQFKVNHQLSSV